MCAVMSFEMRALCVGFAAAHVVARVRGDPLPGPGAAAAFGLRLLGQTVPTGDHEGFCAAERTFKGVTLGQQVRKLAFDCSFREETKRPLKVRKCETKKAKLVEISKTRKGKCSG